jgi:hypothetical protein
MMDGVRLTSSHPAHGSRDLAALLHVVQSRSGADSAEGRSSDAPVGRRERDEADTAEGEVDVKKEFREQMLRQVEGALQLEELGVGTALGLDVLTQAAAVSTGQAPRDKKKNAVASRVGREAGRMTLLPDEEDGRHDDLVTCQEYLRQVTIEVRKKLASREEGGGGGLRSCARVYVLCFEYK